MSEEHPNAEALEVLASACDVGTVTVFAFHSHQWLVFFLHASSPALPWLVFCSL